LSPFSFDFLALLQLEGSSCGKACCQKTGVCCCHKTRPAGTGGPLWKAASQCGRNCGVLPALPGPVAATLVAHRSAANPALPVSRLQVADTAPRGSAENGFALFQRPPQSSGRSGAD